MSRTLPSDWRDMQLTKSFKLGEFYISDSYPDVALQMTPTAQEAQNCYLQCVFLWQPIRDEFGSTSITSGVRHQNLNKLVGGVASSQHVLAESSDGKCTHANMEKVYWWCVNDLKYKGELIYYPKRGHLHGALPSPFFKADQFIHPTK